MKIFADTFKNLTARTKGARSAGGSGGTAGTERSTRPMSREKADTLLLIGTCVLVLLPHAAHLPVWIMPSCLLLLFWRGWITFRGNRMPPRWLLLPVAVAAMAGVYWSHKTFFGRDAGVAMLSLLLTLKLLEMHAKRDLFIVLFLSYFLILSSFFYSQSIATALMTIAAVVAILTTQVSFQYTGAVPSLGKRLRLGASILAMAAPLTLVLFLLFPRIQGPLWGMPGDAQSSGRTGLSDSMAPGNISRLALSDDVAFRVKFEGQAPANPQLYWRGVVLSQFDGRTWTPLQAARAGRLQTVLEGEPLRYQVTLEPHGRRWLFALEMPQALPQLAGNTAALTADAQMLASQPITDRIRYDLASHTGYRMQPNASAGILQQWIDLPAGFNPRTLAYAAELSRNATSPEQLVESVLKKFRAEPYRYTLEPPALGRHAVDEFLFDTKAGFCEHYSGAFVVLMRALGIPARVVTGYQGGELNPVDGFMTVRQSDAHAWAEVWLAQRGWVRIDPTAAVAPARVQQNLRNFMPQPVLGGLFSLDASQNPLLKSWLSLRQRFDAINNGWNQWVLNYTPDKQRRFFESLGFPDVDWRTMTAVMMICAVAAMAAVVLPLLLHQRKRDPMTALYDAFCRRMAQRGLERRPHEGPRAYSIRLVAPESPLPQQTKAALARFLEVYETVRYGAPAPDARAHELSSLKLLKSLLAECR
jgi:transglutaminase-like putative cysteine protease